MSLELEEQGGEEVLEDLLEGLGVGDGTVEVEGGLQGWRPALASEGFGELAGELVETLQNELSETGGKLVTRELLELVDVFNAQAMEGLEQVVGQSKSPERKMGEGGGEDVGGAGDEGADARGIGVFGLRVGFEGEGVGRAGGWGDGEDSGDAEAMEGSGDGLDHGGEAAEEVLAAGEVEVELGLGEC